MQHSIFLKNSCKPEAGRRMLDDSHLCSRARSAACCGWRKRPRSRSWTRRTGSSGWRAGWCRHCEENNTVALATGNKKWTLNCSQTSTCTGVAAWGRPPCLKSICKTSNSRCQSREHPAASGIVRENVSHEVPAVIVGQDFGDVPVPGGQRLQDVCARVRLRHRTNTI